MAGIDMCKMTLDNCEAGFGKKEDLNLRGYEIACATQFAIFYRILV